MATDQEILDRFIGYYEKATGTILHSLREAGETLKPAAIHKAAYNTASYALYGNDKIFVRLNEMSRQHKTSLQKMLNEQNKLGTYNHRISNFLERVGVHQRTPSALTDAKIHGIIENTLSGVSESVRLNLMTADFIPRFSNPIMPEGKQSVVQGVADEINPVPTQVNPFYSEHEFLQLDEILYQYQQNEAASEWGRIPPLHDMEKEYIENYKDLFDIDPDEEDINKIRQTIIDTNNGVGKPAEGQSAQLHKVSNELIQDRRELQITRRALQSAKRSQQSVYEVLSSTRDSKIAEAIVQFSNDSGIRDNEQLLYRLRRTIEDGSILNHEIGTAVGDEHRTIDDMIRHIGNIESRAWNEKDSVFGDSIRKHNAHREFGYMLNQMYARRREMDADFSGFVTRQEERGSLLSLDERRNLEAETRRFIAMQDANERYFKRHQELLEQYEREDGTNARRPLSPVNQIRRGVVDSLTDVNETRSDQATNRMLAFLRSGSTIEEQLREEALNNYREELRAYEERAGSQKQIRDRLTPLYEALSEEEKAAGIVTDPETGRKYSYHHLSQGLQRPVEPTEQDINDYIARNFRDHVMNEDRLDYDTYKSLSETWETNEMNRREQIASGERISSVEVVEPKRPSERYYNQWKQIDSDQRIRVGNDKVARRKVGLEGKNVFLEAEHVVASDITTHIELKRDLETVLDNVADREYRNTISKQEMRERVDRIMDEQFVEVIYKNNWVNDELKEKNERLHSWLKQTETHARKTAQRLNTDIDTVVQDVSVRNLVEQFNLFMTPVRDGASRSGVESKYQFRLPQYLQDMIATHSNWMNQIGNADEIMSVAYDALAQTMQDYGKSQKTIDLTDEGFIRAWERQGKSANEIKKLLEGIQGKGIKDRFEDAVFLDVMGNIHQKWFEYSGKNSDAIESLIYQIQDEIISTGQSLPEERSGERIHYQGTPQQIKARAQASRGTIELFPYYRQVLEMSDQQIEEILVDRHREGRSSLSFEDHMQRMLSGGADGDAESFEDVINQTTREQIGDEAYQERYAETHLNDRRYRDFRDNPEAFVDELEDVVSGEKSPREYLMENFSETNDVLKNSRVQGIGDLETRLRIEEAQGQDYVRATIPYQGQDYTAHVRRGNRGDLLAEIPSLGINVKVVNRAEDALEMHNTFDLRPTTMYGGEVIEDIVDAGPLQKEFPFVYDDVQAKGAGFRTQANPSDSLALMSEFRQGEMPVTYFDLETTGVDNSMLPRRMLQPLELYAQQMQWDPEADDFVRVGDRNIGIIGPDGQPTMNNLHVFIRPNEQMIDYANMISDRLDTLGTSFTIDQARKIQGLKLNAELIAEDIVDDSGKVVDRSYRLHAAEYSRLGRRDKERLHNLLLDEENGRRLTTSLEKNDARFWYLRNIAKFSNSENYARHAGNEPIGSTNLYLESLREDTQKGLRNLERVGRTDSIGRALVRFSEEQQAVDSPREMVNLLTEMIGDNPIAGQNVSEADWAKITRVLDDDLKTGYRNFRNLSEGIAEELTQVRDTMLDRVASTEGLDDQFAYVRNAVEKIPINRVVVDETMRQRSIVDPDGQRMWVPMHPDEYGHFERRNVTDMDIRAGYNDPWQFFEMDEANQEAARYMHQDNRPDPDPQTVRRNQADIVGGRIRPLEDLVHVTDDIRAKLDQMGLPQAGYMANDTIMFKRMPIMAQRDGHLERTVHRLEPIAEGELAQLQQDETRFQQMLDDGEITRITPDEVQDGTRYLSDSEKQERRRELARRSLQSYSGIGTPADERDTINQLDNLIQAFREDPTSISEEQINSLRVLSEERGLGINADSLAHAGDQLRQIEQDRRNLTTPRVIEQMFASRMAHPEAIYHNAEAQIERAGVNVDGDLHKASTDTRAGMETLGVWMREIFEDPSMEGYKPEVLQAGALIQNTKSQQGDLPLGIYQIDELTDRSMKLRGLDQQTYNVEAPTAHEFQRRYFNNFDFLFDGGDPTKLNEAFDRFAEDAARNYIDNANQSAFTFDLHELHAREIDRYGEIRNEPLRRLQNQYDRVGEAPEGLGQDIAYRNAELFGTNEINNWLNEGTSVRQQFGFNIAKDYYSSGEGKARRAFLNDLEALQKVDAITSSESAEMLRHFNEQIKEEGRRRGYTRKLENRTAVTVPASGYGRFNNQNFAIDLTNQNTVAQSIWGMAESMKELGGDILAETGVRDITDEQKKTQALNTFVMNTLRENQLIDDYKAAGDPTPTVASAAKQIMSKRDQLTPFEEYDLLGYRNRDADFIRFINEAHEGILADRKAQLSPLQQDRIASYEDTKLRLKKSRQYHPALNIPALASDRDLSTIRFDNFGGLSNLPIDDVLQLADEMKTNTELDRNTRNAIYNTLFRHATAGRNNSLEGMMTSAVEPNRLAAMEALNWITPATGDVSAELQSYNEGRDDLSDRIREAERRREELRSGGASSEVLKAAEDDTKRLRGERDFQINNLEMAQRTGYQWNQDVANWRFGLPGQYASSTMGEMPSQIIQNIVNEVDTRYTNISGMGVIRRQLEQWINQGMPGRNPDAPVFPTKTTYETVTQDYLMEQGLKENEARDMLRQMQETSAELEMGEPRVANQVNAYPEATPTGRSILGQGIDRAKSTWDNFATAITDSGAGRAAGWIAGIGLGLYAAKQFFSAGDPLKFERRPSGHGGDSIVGYADEDETGPPPNQASTGGNTAYVTPESQGYRVKARAVNNNNVNIDAVSAQLSENLGEMNINLRDEQTSMDRQWLEEQFSSFIDRGHV